MALSFLLTACNLPVQARAIETPNPALVASTQTVQVLSTPSAVSTPFDTFAPSPSATHTPLILSTTASTTSFVVPASAASACNQAQFVRDETVPDGTIFPPGATFVKTWRLKNVGTCMWTPGYLLAFDHGQNIGPSGRSPDPVALSTAVAPGQTVDMTVNLTAPTAPGHYQADFYLRSATGVSFGVGPSRRGTFWVKIVVVPPTPTNTATAISYP